MCYILSITLISSSAAVTLKYLYPNLSSYITNLASQISFSEVSSRKSTSTTSGNNSSKGGLETSLKAESELHGMHRVTSNDLTFPYCVQTVSN